MLLHASAVTQAFLEFRRQPPPVTGSSSDCASIVAYVTTFCYFECFCTLFDQIDSDSVHYPVGQLARGAFLAGGQKRDNTHLCGAQLQGQLDLRFRLDVLAR